MDWSVDKAPSGVTGYRLLGVNLPVTLTYGHVYYNVEAEDRRAPEKQRENMTWRLNLFSENLTLDKVVYFDSEEAAKEWVDEAFASL